jgi:hypothetical protein
MRGRATVRDLSVFAGWFGLPNDEFLLPWRSISAEQRLAGQLAASTSRSARTWSTPAVSNIFERWESQAALETFRSSGPDTEQRPAMLTVSVQEYDIADVRPVFGKEAE